MPDNKYTVFWTQIATSDLESIVAFIAEGNKDAALQVLSEIKKGAFELYNFPNRGRSLPELRKFGIKIYREIIVKVWRVIYRVQDNNVYILAVFDSRRNIEDILLNRLLIS